MCVCIFAFLSRFFPRNCGKVEVANSICFFFSFRTLEQFALCSSLHLQLCFWGKESFFWRCRKIFCRNERKLQLEASGNTFCFRNSDSLKYVAAFSLSKSKKKKMQIFETEFYSRKKPDHLISTAKVALTTLPFPPSISAQRKSKREKKKRSKMQGNLRRKIAPREVVCSRPFIFSAKKKWGGGKGKRVLLPTLFDFLLPIPKHGGGTFFLRPFFAGNGEIGQWRLFIF